MQIYDVTNINLVDINLSAKNKDEVFSKLAKKLLIEGFISNQEEFISSLYQRETEGSTYCGYEIAIPHGISKCVNKVSMCLSKVENIDWDKDGCSNVKYIFLLAMPELDDMSNNLHIKLLSEIAISAMDEDFRNSWDEVKSSQEFLDKFKTYEEKKNER
ncbi:MAG: PTS sugar transporter subunit IIA [Anaerorhabdus sp.]|uniref:PTS sugar transporter subunit IIA n=1 Tax=Anaerorhabdus sp. TaxID=1872524 RepID=UPI002FC6A2BF